MLAAAAEGAAALVAAFLLRWFGVRRLEPEGRHGVAGQATWARVGRRLERAWGRGAHTTQRSLRDPGSIRVWRPPRLRRAACPRDEAGLPCAEDQRWGVV